MSISPSGAMGFQRLTYFEILQCSKLRSKFILGPDIAENMHYIQKYFKWRKSRLQECFPKAHPHCKLPSQIGGATWSSGLVEQLTSLGVDDKPSGIVSNKTDHLRHPVWLNGGKLQRKDEVSDFFDHNFCHPLHSHPITIAGPWIRNIASSSNIFENFKFSKMLDKDAISIAMGGGGRGGRNWMTKIAAEKKSETSVRFFWLRFSHPTKPPHAPLHRNHHRTLDG